MKVTFILHSCYFVELETCCLLFDYYEGSVPETDKPLYAFASHSHGDHFSEKLFDLPRQGLTCQGLTCQGLTGQGKETCYLLSRDIFQSRVPEELREQTVFVKPHETYEVGNLKVATLKSTDAGVAFLVQCEGKLLYHAGDLNCWVWDGAPKFQNDQMTVQYKKELSLLSGKHLNAAFVPLDPRQGMDYCRGMELFFEAADADHVFPMHMWEDYSVVPRFKTNPAFEPYADRVMDVKSPGQVFEI